MKPPRLALLNPASNYDMTARNFQRELDADIAQFQIQDGQLPKSDDFDGCVVTGSRASVYWDEEWIPPLKSWVGDAIEGGLPFLGVCFGHQLLADVLGGTVEDMGEYEIGYRDVTHENDDPLFDGIDDRFTAFMTHSDRVVEIPPGAMRIASNDYGVHGFRKGSVVGVQFHPEYDMETARLVTQDKDELPESVRESVLEGITADNYAAACQAKIVFDNFVDSLEQQRPTPSPAD